MNRHNLDCQTAIVLFKITHEDRAGQTGTATLRWLGADEATAAVSRACTAKK